MSFLKSNFPSLSTSFQGSKMWSKSKNEKQFLETKIRLEIPPIYSSQDKDLKEYINFWSTY